MPLDDWLKIDITTYHATGEEVVTYSHTPEEFVAELKRRGERLYVTKGSCCECHYTPDHFIPKEAIERHTQQALSYHHFLECTCTAIARFQRKPGVPDFVICYGFYYQFVYCNKYLLAAKEAGLVTFYDVANLPGLRETGLKTYPDYFTYTGHPPY